jgi:hypothetical protein
MSKFNPGNLLWFGTAPVPPEPALGCISQSPEFLACYAEDVAKLSAINRLIYRYLLQPDLAGSSELFAECVGATQGQSCFQNSSKDMPEYFPSSYLFVKNRVDRLTTEFPQESHYAD